ncbi:MAG: DUF3781 domain-containing protein [Cytophagales bacterium]
MDIDKSKILDNICYTELVYGRINKKLKTTLSKREIEEKISQMLFETVESDFVKIGKNYYATNTDKQIRITINSNTFRIITVDKI